MNAANVTPSAPVLPLKLHWTVGFSGKRFPACEERAARAIRQALDWLQEQAALQDAQLTALSSIARGGDVCFARACLAMEPPLPWKCLLPFAQTEFLHLDLESDQNLIPLTQEEISARISTATSCIKGAFDVHTPTTEPPSPPPQPLDPLDPDGSKARRVVAYLECGYRTVDESDVMICLLRADEFAALLSGGNSSGDQSPTAAPVKSLKAGTLAIARYANAARRPCLLLNADAADPWKDRKLLNDPQEQKPKRALFLDDVTTALIRRTADPFTLPLDPGNMTGGPVTAARQSVLFIQRRLGALANSHKGKATGGLKWMLALHLAATAVAAVGATFFNPQLHFTGGLFAVAISLACIKPVLAGCAAFIEHRLHHHADRDHWLHARELAELCRGALSLWPLPIQPLDAADEEDFPKLKRLLRTLRLVRALDPAASVTATPRQPAQHPNRTWERETQIEADMRAATAIYIQDRLLSQANHYYQRHHKSGVESERRWRAGFLIAIWTAIGAGTLLAILEILHAREWHVPAWSIMLLMALVIIAPFVATWTLGMMTILDCRRRARRYDEMECFLRRIAATLENCTANPSRLSLIEHAERMMIEEQHEWFSVTRNYTV